MQAKVDQSLLYMYTACNVFIKVVCAGNSHILSAVLPVSHNVLRADKGSSCACHEMHFGADEG